MDISKNTQIVNVLQPSTSNQNQNSIISLTSNDYPVSLKKVFGRDYRNSPLK